MLLAATKKSSYDEIIIIFKSFNRFEKKSNSNQEFRKRFLLEMIKKDMVSNMPSVST